MVESIRRSGDGLVVVFHAGEVELLRDLGGQLESVLAGGVPERGGDPVRDRLFPRAYLDPTEDQAESEWQAAVHEDLAREKQATIGVLIESLDAGTQGRKGTLAVTLSAERVEQWVAALNDVRLALGIVLGVTEDAVEVAPGDPRIPGLELWDWLSWLQGSLIQELLAATPEPGAEDE